MQPQDRGGIKILVTLIEGWGSPPIGGSNVKGQGSERFPCPYEYK